MTLTWVRYFITFYLESLINSFQNIDFCEVEKGRDNTEMTLFL